MQTMYYTTRNFIRHTDNVVDLTEYRRRLARAEGILVDPVYTGKAWSGLLQGLEQGWFGSEGDIIFVHTGGAAALFAIDLPRN